MDYFEKTTNNILNRINKIDPQRSNAQTMTEREKKRHIFEGRMLHSWGGKLQGLPKHWEFPRASFFGGIVIWHMGSGKDNVPALKLLSSHHFNHLKRGQKKFRDLKILNHHVKKAAIETNSWRPQNDWDEMKLMIMYNAIKTKFDFGTRTQGKAKRFDQLSWETILDKLKKNKYKLA